MTLQAIKDFYLFGNANQPIKKDQVFEIECCPAIAQSYIDKKLAIKYVETNKHTDNTESNDTDNGGYVEGLRQD